MDTSVIPVETNDHLELTEARKKLAKRDQRQAANAGYGATTEGMAITKTYLGAVTKAVTEKLSGPRRSSNSAEFSLERMLRQLDPEVLALCLLQSGLHAAGSDKTTLTSAAVSIGQAINDELWAAKLLQTNKKVAHRINKAAKERFGRVDLRKAYAKREAAAELGFEMQDWGRKLLVRAGMWGVDRLLEAMPLVFERMEPRGYNGDYHWGITPFGSELAAKALDEAVRLSPVYQPRTERPKDWDTFVMRVAEDDRTLDRAQLLRTHHKDTMSAARYAIRSGTMAPALTALNTLQSVPFKINTWIMDVIAACYAKGIAVEGLPSKRQLEVPKRMPADVWEEMTVEQRRLHAKTRRGRQQANRANDADNIMYGEDMRTAARLAVVDQFYTPMNMDWRGRVYSLTQFNFQREDRVRAMFLFANGEPIGEEGIYWLKVHVANCGAFDKIDKQPLEARVKWVDDNLATLTDYVRRPMYRTDWTKADSPFLFLAACKELVEALSAGSQYVTHLPVSFDGSCSGIQHLAAMTKAADEGSYVNLTNNGKPADIYQLVADVAKKMIEEDIGNYELFGKSHDDQPDRKTVATYDHLARTALAFGVDRKLVKRNVMTFPYSSKEFGMSEQQFEDTMLPQELKLLKGEIENHPFGETDDEWRLASRYLAKRVYAAIKKVINLPAEAMAFMQTLARVMAHEGKPLRWTSPAGIPCINRYHPWVEERIELWCNDKGVKKKIRLSVGTSSNEATIDKDKAAAGIAPNFVHSHDAAHLLLTVAACAAEGLTDIATVHDSFGCLPSRAGRFNHIIREQFLKMYTDHDVLNELLESARADLTPDNQHKLPAMPMVGTLNLTEILDAKYAFA